MSDFEQFDSLLAAHFNHEHQQIPADAFVASVMHRIRFQRRFATGIRTVLQVAALLAAVIASPWLIAGAARLNATLASSLTWIADLPGAWVLGALAIVVVLTSRVRSR
jgi:hypothetical protein